MIPTTEEMRDAFFDALHGEMREDPRIMVVTNDLGAPSLDRFRTDFPHSFINAGVSEQNIISIAAGLAMAGRRVCVYSIASFITLRCLEQIKLDLCVMNLPVTIAAVGPCFAYAADGPSHHASEDIALLRAMANVSIWSPCDARSAAALASVVRNNSGPAYVRLDRGARPPVYGDAASFGSGFSVLRQGADVCCIATGIMTHTALAAAGYLDKQGIAAAVIDVCRLKPLPGAGLLAAAGASAALVTIEEHTMNGGLGSIIAEAGVDAGLRLPLLRLGLGDDRLYAYGSRESLHAAAGLDCGSVVQRIAAWLRHGAFR